MLASWNSKSQQIISLVRAVVDLEKRSKMESGNASQTLYFHTTDADFTRQSFTPQWTGLCQNESSGEIRDGNPRLLSVRTLAAVCLHPGDPAYARR